MSIDYLCKNKVKMPERLILGMRMSLTTVVLPMNVN